MPAVLLQPRSTSPSSLSSGTITPTMQSLLIALTALLALALLLVLGLYLLHRRRVRRNSHTVQVTTTPGLTMQGSRTRRSRHRRDNSVLTISAGNMYTSPTAQNPSSEKFIVGEMGDSAPSTPKAGVVPEIRITFPDDEDEKDRRSRVVVVKVTEMGGVGLEPLGNDKHGLPRYEEKEGFKEIDLERCGGLKETKI